MSEVLVFSNKNAKAVTDVLTSLGDDWSIIPRSFTDEFSVRDPSEPACIVVCFPEDEIGTTLEASCQKLENYLKNNGIHSRTPIIPIVYEVESAEPGLEFPSTWFNRHPSLNFLNNGLFWFKEESAEEFQCKITSLRYRSGYPVTKSSYEDDDDLSGKNASIADAVATVAKYAFIVLGVIAGLLAGGLIGGLVFGGLAAILGGLAIGLISGPILGWLTSRCLFGVPGDAAARDAENRSVALQQQKELTERNAQWEIFQERFFPRGAFSPMNPPMELHSNKSDYQPLFRSPKNDQKAAAYPSMPDESEQSTSPEELPNTDRGMVPG